MKCADCPAIESGRSNGAWARGLCRRCYDRHSDAGNLEQFPRTHHSHKPQADVIEDWLFLKAQGYTRRNAAERMGMTKKALEQAITRARHAGNPQLLESEAA